MTINTPTVGDIFRGIWKSIKSVKRLGPWTLPAIFLVLVAGFYWIEAPTHGPDIFDPQVAALCDQISELGTNVACSDTSRSLQETARRHAFHIAIAVTKALLALYFIFCLVFHSKAQNTFYEFRDELREIVGKWKEGGIDIAEAVLAVAMALASISHSIVLGLVLYAIIQL